MAKRGGYGGMGMMPGNMNNLMKQAQKMQKQMEETTKALEEKEYEAELVSRGFMREKIRKYGFAFEGKNVLIGEHE